MSKESEYLKPTMKLKWREATPREIASGIPYSKVTTGFYESEFILEQWWESDPSGKDGKWIPIEVER